MHGTDDVQVIQMRSLKMRHTLHLSMNKLVFFMHNYKFCTIIAWRLYSSDSCPNSSGPAFMTLEGWALVAKVLTNTLQLAVMTAGHSTQVAVTLHSVWQVGEQACVKRGVPLKHIKVPGSWTADMGRTYVTNIPSVQPQDLSPYCLDTKYVAELSMLNDCLNLYLLMKRYDSNILMW